ncbi:MAG: exonuclease subunit SbcD [Oceanospirillaceae bacterium]|nr:exonuclease subunit SbcD [Oceanospirillaceae bacterium]
MRVLHTSDWHLGQHFIGKSRLAEHQKFVQWLVAKIKENQIDAVIIAGDVYDTGSPPSYARELYNELVVQINQQGCQLIVLGGNHDSVSTLNESKGLLKHLSAEVIASVDAEAKNQVITLKESTGKPGAILCAIPYLRPRDLMQSKADQSAKDKAQALGSAIADHYQTIYALAEKKREELGLDIPIIATGHLTAMGVKSSDSVRDIYVGNLEAFPASAFPPADYIALGHIHRPQIVAQSEHIRYCGSPIPLSFDEIGSQKQVLIAEFDDNALVSVEPLHIPMFQPMQVIKGDLASIEAQLAALNHPAEALPIWLSVEVEAQDYLNDLTQRVEQLTADLNVEVLLLRRARKQRRSELTQQSKETLSELNAYEVFDKRVQNELFETDQEQSRLERIKQSFCQIVTDVEEQHGMASSKPAVDFLSSHKQVHSADTQFNSIDSQAQRTDTTAQSNEAINSDRSDSVSDDTEFNISVPKIDDKNALAPEHTVVKNTVAEQTIVEPLALFAEEPSPEPIAQLSQEPKRRSIQQPVTKAQPSKRQSIQQPVTKVTSATTVKRATDKSLNKAEIKLDQDDLFASMLTDETSEGGKHS